MANPPKLLSTHLLAFLTVVFMSGIVAASLRQIHLDTAFTAFCAVLLILFVCFQRSWNVSGFIISFVLFFLAGLLMGVISSREPDGPHHIYRLIETQQDIVAIGHLHSMPTFNGTTSQATIDLKSVRLGPDKPHITAIGSILLRLPGPWPNEYAPGDLLAFRAVVQRPSAYGVPGVFDYPAELARRDIWVTGFSRSPTQIHKIVNTASMLEHIRYSPELLRSHIGNFLDQRTAPDIGGLYRAILLGDRSHLSSDILERFKLTGSLHILAISGIHLSIIGTLLFSLIYWLLRRSEWLILHANVRKLSGIICLPLLIGYTLLAGSNTPVVRACLMSIMIILAFCSNRTRTLSSLIALGALLVLTASPQSLFTASFQLSFAAFISIALVLPGIERLLRQEHTDDTPAMGRLALRLRNWTISAVIVSSAAVLGTAPIVIFHFHRFPLVGPLTNLVMEPLLCLWALPWGFAALPFIPLMPETASTFFAIGSVGLHLAIRFANLFQDVTWASLWLPRSGTLLTICYYCTFFLTLHNLTTPHSMLRRSVFSVFFLALFSFLLLPGGSQIDQQNGTTAVYFLDVGQGSATLIRFADNTHMLVDGGGSAYSRETVGQRIIAPFLWNSGINRLETIVLTHPDGDHSNGIPFFLEHFSPKKLYTSTLEGNGRYKAIINLARKKGVKVVVADSGDILKTGSATVTCLANTVIGQTGDTGNEGLVVALHLGQHRLLLPGDIDSKTEQRILAAGMVPKSEFLLAAHHGSSTSSSAKFLEYVDPQAIFVSAGKSQNQLFPSETLRKYCQSAQLPLLVTAEVGTIRLVQKGNKTKIQVLQDNKKNPLRRRLTTWLTTEHIAAIPSRDVILQ